MTNFPEQWYKRPSKLQLIHQFLKNQRGHYYNGIQELFVSAEQYVLFMLTKCHI